MFIDLEACTCVVCVVCFCSVNGDVFLCLFGFLLVVLVVVVVAAVGEGDVRGMRFFFFWAGGGGELFLVEYSVIDEKIFGANFR